MFFSRVFSMNILVGDLIDESISRNVNSKQNTLGI